jgi:6-phosphogluconolactonase
VTSPKIDVVYVPCQSDNAVFANAFDSATGTLSPLPGSPFPVGSVPLYVTTDPAGKFLYVSNAFSSDISAFTINALSGALVPIAGSPFANGTSPITLAVDPSATFLYVTNDASTISAYRISDKGGLGASLGSFPVGTEPRAIAMVSALE